MHCSAPFFISSSIFMIYLSFEVQTLLLDYSFSFLSLIKDTISCSILEHLFQELDSFFFLFLRLHFSSVSDAYFEVRFLFFFIFFQSFLFQLDCSFVFSDRRGVLFLDLTFLDFLYFLHKKSFCSFFIFIIFFDNPFYILNEFFQIQSNLFSHTFQVSILYNSISV